jgi:hypothetical protein
MSPRSIQLILKGSFKARKCRQSHHDRFINLQLKDRDAVWLLTS